MKVSLFQAAALAVLNGQTAPLSLDHVRQRLGCSVEVTRDPQPRLNPNPEHQPQPRSQLPPQPQRQRQATKRVLYSLSCNPMCRVVRGHLPKSAGSGDGGFIANSAFASSKRSFRIPMAPLVNRPATDDPPTPEYLVDAHVVRTMKRRTRMTHEALVAEVASRLIETPCSANIGDDLIARRISNLVEREYLAKRLAADGAWTGEYEYQP